MIAAERLNILICFLLALGADGVKEIKRKEQHRQITFHQSDELLIFSLRL